MISFPPAKINIGLDVLHKRDDGFHAIRSIFYPLPLTDILEVIPSEKDGVALTTSGLPISGDSTNNLVVKALAILQREHGIGGVRMHLRKVIPMGAGLGGGSADGAHALRLMNALFELNLPTETLQAYAAELGSDCPFFLQDEAMLVTGRGEFMTPHPLDLSGKFLTLIMPDFGIETGPAYGSITPQDRPDLLSDLHSFPLKEWKNRALNHFETGSLEAYQKVAQLKDDLYAAGAFYASMTGSGAAVFGVFEQETSLSPSLSNCQIFKLEL